MGNTDVTLITTLSLLILLSPFISKFIRLPTPAVEIILGSIVAYFGFIGTSIYYDLIAEVGFLYLMFLAGMEVELKQILQTPKKILKQSFLFLTLMMLLCVTFGFLFHLHIIVILSMPLISIGLLASLSKTYGKEKEWIKLAFVAGVIGEILSIGTLTIFDAYILTGWNSHLAMKLGYLFAFVLTIYLLYKLLHILFWWYPEIKQMILPKVDTASQDIRLSMSLFFMLIAIMLFLDLELALGAFIAGIAISEFFHHEKKLEEKMSSLGFGFLIPLFFIHVGASFNLKELLIEGVVSGAVLITFLMLSARVLAGILLKNISGAKNALLVSLSLSMPLTLLVAVATIGLHSGHLEQIIYYQLILASILEILFSMTVIKILQK